MRGLSPEERFWFKVEKTETCWLWTGGLDADGYGEFSLTHSKTVRAHRYAYESLVGTIPAGLVIDHVRKRGCVNRHCVNPAHLEPVATRENLLRGDTFQARNAAKTHCIRGHPFDAVNTDYSHDSKGPRRRCRACHRDTERRRRERGVQDL
jgi:hypothetical protein